MTSTKAQLIAFSGIDGGGKSTQIQLLMKSLAAQGRRPVYLWSRGGYTGPFNALKGCIRGVLGKKIVPSGRTEQRTRMFRKVWVRNLWLALAMIDLALVYGLYIRFLVLTGKTVIADRYLWDTMIDFRLNFPEADVTSWRLWRFLEWFSPKPDQTFLLLVPVEESLRRSLLKKEPFPDSEKVLRQRLEHYSHLSRKLDWQVIDCMRPVEDIAAEIQAVVMPASGSLR